MQRVLITGGSGFVGRHLVKRLRVTRPHLEVRNLDVVSCVDLPSDRQHIGSLEDDGAYAGIPPVDAIVHLAAVSREPGFATRRYYETNAHGTAMLAKWAERMGVPRILFFSSISVYGRAELPTTENSLTAPETPYGMSKLLAEQELAHWRQRNDATLGVVRPGVVFGPGDDGNFSRLARAVRRGWFVFPGRTDTRKAAIYVKDLVELTDWLLGHDFTDLTVNAVYDQAATTAEIVEFMQRAMGRQSKRIVVIPESLARAGVGLLGLAESRKPPAERTFHQRRIDKLVSSSNIVSANLPKLGFRFGHTMESAIEEWLGETVLTSR